MKKIYKLIQHWKNIMTLAISQRFK